MKMMIRILALAATVATLAVSTWANTLPTGQDQCTSENKDSWYATFRENYKGDQQVKAYDAAKKYLTCSPEETDITKYLKRFVTAYEKEIRKVKLAQLIYTDHKYPEAYALGREILVDEPENVKVMVDLGASGYLVAPLKNPALNADALNYARKAMTLLGSGKTVTNWTPFSGADDALAYLNYTIGTLTLEQDPSSALSFLIKAAQSNTPLKKSPLPYAYIGGAYESGPYGKQFEEYTRLYKGKDETPESKLALANINQVVDRMIDAYARAVAAAGTDPNYSTQKPQWSESLSSWYKYRHQSEAGMTEMVASILAKPLPPEPTPLTSLPASTPAATPASNSGATANGTTGAATNKPAMPGGSAATQTATKTVAPTGNSATKPAGTKTTSTTGPGRPRNNHRSH